MSNEAMIAQKGPYATAVKAGTTYYWCACGHSKNPPFCDGSHKGIGFAPVAFAAEKSETVYACGRKRTSQRPFCDGSHKTL